MKELWLCIWEHLDELIPKVGGAFVLPMLISCFLARRTVFCKVNLELGMVLAALVLATGLPLAIYDGLQDYKRSRGNRSPQQNS